MSVVLLLSQVLCKYACFLLIMSPIYIFSGFYAFLSPLSMFIFDGLSYLFFFFTSRVVPDMLCTCIFQAVAYTQSHILRPLRYFVQVFRSHPCSL
jgi:hypothetical protein